VSDPQPTLAAPSTPTHLDPGSTLANRYRIITLLGKGGMGEVYRADDLTLGVSVALKFLPASLALDPLRLEHFRSEVRLARQVSHPNVCRVFDIGQTEGPGGRVFLSMEYVDGEDLASLLRRIGRLPSDKAVQIARQLCFGLAAAHEQGIIHRDLKPANIMLDGRGQARIMDFGIAGAATDLAIPGAAIAGTPGYMSPEQLSGGEVTKRSDLYSLGILLYELFTGRAVFTATAIEDLRKQQSDSTNLTRPSAFIADIDPAVERIILQCLEHDPKNRPPSAMSIAAALPGGDPLAAALAAGETPSPELIAAAGATDALPPAKAYGRAALIVALLAAVVLITAPWSMVSKVKPDKSPAILEDRASEMLRDLGYTDPPADSARGLNFRTLFISSINRDKTITDKEARLRARPGVYEFWYRRSPTPIRSTNDDNSVAYQSPFPSSAGEILIRTDSAGRLETLLALPPRFRTPGASTDLPEDAVKKLFAFADLDFSRFTPAEPVARSFVPSDTVKSWTGSLADPPDYPVRVHIGAVEGRVNHFSINYPFSPPPAPPVPTPPKPSNPGASFIEYATGLFFLAILIFTAWLAIDNLRSNRGDRTTSFRLGLFTFAMVMISMVASYHRFPSARMIFFQGDGIAPAVFAAVQFWLFYTALEPYARRVYPHALVSWTRLARGGWNDPLVGRHILVGLLLGSVSVLCTAIFALAANRVAVGSSVIAIFGRTGNLSGGIPGYTASAASCIVIALMIGAGTMLPLVMGELSSKRRWVGYLVLITSLAIMHGQGLASNTIDALIGIVIALIPVLAIRPGGLLALVTTNLTIFLGLSIPVGLDWSHWFTAPALIPAGMLAALVLLSTRAAVGKPAKTRA
jgi:serine/threonine protein kinase